MIDFPTPAREDFTSLSEVIVWHHADAVPDSFNRIQFTAFWWGYHHAVGDSVRAQVFHTDLAAFIAAEEAKDKTVRVVTS